MSLRQQHTIGRVTEVAGVGFLTGADLQVRFLPAAAGAGISFRRTDLSGSPVLPAQIDFVAPRTRRTALECRGVHLELIEHAMAALAGLGIDNCLVEINGAEIPGCDGSSQAFVQALSRAGLVAQGMARQVFAIREPFALDCTEPDVSVTGVPVSDGSLRITYELDYGPDSPIPAQTCAAVIDPTTFANEIAFSRTFILESEVAAFLAQGMGQRLSFQDLLVYGATGVVGNSLRAPDECARHKVLDCVGDLALLGCGISGHFTFRRTGHRHNADLVRCIRQQMTQQAGCRRDAA